MANNFSSPSATSPRLSKTGQRKMVRRRGSQMCRMQLATMTKRMKTTVTHGLAMPTPSMTPTSQATIDHPSRRRKTTRDFRRERRLQRVTFDDVKESVVLICNFVSIRVASPWCCERVTSAVFGA